jgi:hypothetical protein
MRKSIAVAGLGVWLSLGSGCAATRAIPAGAPPQPTVAAAVALPPADVAEDAHEGAAAANAPQIGQPVKHHVEITVDRLPKPKSVHAAATVFVFWVRGSEDEAWANAAHLAPSAEAQVAEMAFPGNVLFVHVTAEPSAEALRPSTSVLMSTRVSRLGACASSVEQNHLQMQVRMCSDVK